MILLAKTPGYRYLGLTKCKVRWEIIIARTSAWPTHATGCWHWASGFSCCLSKFKYSRHNDWSPVQNRQSTQPLLPSEQTRSRSTLPHFWKSYINDNPYNDIIYVPTPSKQPDFFLNQIIWSQRWPYNCKNYILTAAIKIEMVPVY